MLRCEHDPPRRPPFFVGRLALFLVLCIGWLLSGSAASGYPLIRLGAAWLYLDDGSNQGTAWRDLNFEDDGWLSGLGQLGYGDGDEVTEVSFGTNSNTKFITTYFRHKFVVPNPGAFTNLLVRLL